MATAQSVCPGPRMSMVPVGSRCCRPQAPGKRAGARVNRASGGQMPAAGRGSILGRSLAGGGLASSWAPPEAGLGQGRELHGSRSLHPGPRAASGCPGERQAVYTAGHGLESHGPGSDPTKPQVPFPLMVTQVSLSSASGSKVEEKGRPRAPPPKPKPWARPPSDPPQGGPTSSWPQLSQWRCLYPPLLQPAGRPDGKVEEHNWARLGFPGAQAGAPEARKLQRGGGPGAGATPEKHQTWPGLQQ